MQMAQLTPTASKTEAFSQLVQQLESLVQAERDALPNCANMTALLYHALPDVNWCGFYLMRHGELVLGPFHGQLACVRIPVGKGVCGAAALRRETLVVPDVHAFAGHIACDAASRSEVVVPLIQRERLLGVLDVDSPIVERFDTDDVRGLESMVETLIRHSDFGGLAI
jgi:GAF domain-containing protein